MKHLALTYVIAGIGVGIFIWLQLPLPWLLGPIFACLIAALAGVPMKGNKLINDAMRSILGVAVGATFTTTLLISMAAMWPTLLMIPVMVACIAVIGVPYFQRVWGFDFATSYYSAMPGGLQDMLAFGEEAGGDVRALSLIHATRVMVVVVALPFILQGYWGADLTNPPGAAASTIDPSQMLLMVFCGIAGWQGAKALGMFGASILGPLILAAIMALLGRSATPPTRRSNLDGTILYRHDRWYEIRRRHWRGGPQRCGGGIGVLPDPHRADVRVRRNGPPVSPRPTYGNAACICAGWSG